MTLVKRLKKSSHVRLNEAQKRGHKDEMKGRSITMEVKSLSATS